MRPVRLPASVLVFVVALIGGACSPGESNGVDAAATRDSRASTTVPDVAVAADVGEPGAGAAAERSTSATRGPFRSGAASSNRPAGAGKPPGSTMLEDPPDTMPGGSYDPAAVAMMREECLRRPTGEFFKDRPRATFADFAASFPTRPLARTTRLPAGDHRELVLVDAGDAGDRTGGYHVLWTGRDPDNAPVKELLEAGGALVLSTSRSSPYATRDGHDPVVVRGHPGGIAQRRWWFCVRVDYWEIDWAAPASRGGGYVYMRVVVSAERFTRAQALALCEAMEDWQG